MVIVIASNSSHLGNHSISPQMGFTFCSRFAFLPVTNISRPLPTLAVRLANNDNVIPSPLKYYLENYSPPSPKVTFTFGKTSFEWNPKYLAAVSPAYSTIPQCSEFEINESNTIISRSAAQIFHRIMPHIQDWDALHQNSSPSEFDELRKVHD